MSKVLLIAGMHRSGTSILSRWVHEMGINMGNKLHPVSKPDKEGHYEDIDFLNFHRKLFDHNNLPYTVKNGEKIKIPDKFKEQAIALIETKSNQKQWGFKDPRTCLLLPFWHKNLTEQGHEVYYLMLYRRKKDVVKSLMKRLYKHHKKRAGQWPLFGKYWKDHLKLTLRKKEFEKEFSDSYERHLHEMTGFTLEANPRNLLHVQYESMIKEQDQIIAQLEKWGFCTKPFSLKTIFEEKLL
ncbi:MAG: hypothetical protein KDC92_13030 [Bacteroidetes bacterium]|nr:hypothetical protein [Bacteroidota bacterium]